MTADNRCVRMTAEALEIGEARRHMKLPIHSRVQEKPNGQKQRPLI